MAAFNMKRILFCLLLFFAVLLGAIDASAQGIPMPWIRPQWLQNSGATSANGFLCTFKAGTSTLQSTFSDLAITSALPNPVHLNSAGRPQTGGGTETEIYLDSSITYKLVLYGPGTGNTCNGTNVGSQIWSQDNILTAGMLGILPFNFTYGGATKVTLTTSGQVGILTAPSAANQFLVTRADTTGSSVMGDFIYDTTSNTVGSDSGAMRAIARQL